MAIELIFDPLFRVPFAVGLVMSAVLPLLGNLLRLRDEWLAALGLAYLAGASGLIGLAFGVPAVLGAPLGAVAGAVGKSFGRFRGNTVYAMMVIVGWATTMLVASNSALGSVMGHALIEGQLYFAGVLHFGAALFGFWRQSLDGLQAIFCISNISDQVQGIALSDINMFENQDWQDLIGKDRYPSREGELQLAPYQTVWITNAPDHQEDA